MRELTVLGTCGAWPAAGRAASGFLLAVDGFRVVVDLGYATFPRLLERCPVNELGAVVITHEHPDHCADLSALSRALLWGEERVGRVPLYCPPDVLDRVQALEPKVRLAEVFDPYPLPGSYQVGPFQVDGRLLPHFVPHAGVRLTVPGLTVAYSGDAGPDRALGELAAGADLLIAGAPLLGSETDPYLLSAGQAGRCATDVGVRRLLLTHFWPDAERGPSVAEASAEFHGEVLAATEGMVLTL